MRSAVFCAMTRVDAQLLADGIMRITDASTTRSTGTPWTRKRSPGAKPSSRAGAVVQVPQS